MSSTAPEFGQEKAHDKYVFESIPKLGPELDGDKVFSLLPQYGGRSGYVYAQWPTSLQRAAEDRGWEGVTDTRSYTIVGPSGQIDCILLCQGDHMPDTDLSSNRRKMYVHEKIAEVTGLSLKTGLIPDEYEMEELAEVEPDAKAPSTEASTLKPELKLSHDSVPEPTNKGKK